MKSFLLAIGALIVIGVVGIGAAAWFAARGEDPAKLEARYATPADRFIEVDGLRVRVRIEGPADAPPIVLLHGYTFSLESWDAWAKGLSATRRVIRYDLAGHGLTGPDASKRYSNEARAAFHIEVMDALGVERADLAGNSLGGLIAWRVAAAHPERVDQLVLVDAGGYPINGVADAPVAAPPPVAAYLLTAPEAGVQAAMQALYGDPSKLDPARVAQVRDLMRRRGNGRAFVEHIAQFTLPDPTASLATIAAPTLILWGEADKLIPVGHAARFQSAIKTAQTKTYPGVGHVPQEEAAAASLADVEAFLAGPEEGVAE